MLASSSETASNRYLDAEEGGGATKSANGVCDKISAGLAYSEFIVIIVVCCDSSCEEKIWFKIFGVAGCLLVSTNQNIC
jgi:hypothetical protein